MGFGDNISKKKEEVNTKVYSIDEIDNILFSETPVQKQKNNRMMALVVGEDGTGKSGLVQDYIIKKHLQNDLQASAVIIDLDVGNSELVQKYHPKYVDRLKVINPIKIKTDSDDGLSYLDYEETISYLRSISHYVKEFHKKRNIKAVVLDGLSTLLKYCEYQMRIEKDVSVEDSANFQYWKLRNKYFEEILDIFKSIEIDRFMIAHDDFIRTTFIDPFTKKEKPVELSSIKQKTNQIAHQKIFMTVSSNQTSKIYNAKILKSKYDSRIEETDKDFLTIKKTSSGLNEINWNTDEIIELLASSLNNDGDNGVQEVKTSTPVSKVETPKVEEVKPKVEEVKSQPAPQNDVKEVETEKPKVEEKPVEPSKPQEVTPTASSFEDDDDIFG